MTILKKEAEMIDFKALEIAPPPRHYVRRHIGQAIEGALLQIF